MKLLSLSPGKKFSIFYLLFLLLFVFTGLSGYGQNALSPGAVLLFKGVKSKLSIAEKNKLYIQTGFVLSADKKQFASDAQSMDDPFDALLLPVDLNNDGTEELFLSFGNTYTSGNTGLSITLFIKGADGNYKMNLGFPGLVPDVLPAAKGYPDLLIGGPGFTFPVWHWNGKAYVFLRSVKDKDLDKLKTKNAEELSKAYQQGIK